jgi:hypothetical protein
LAKNREDKENGNIVKDLQRRNCAVCTHLSQTVFDYFSRWINSFSNDSEVQKKYADDLGFCPFHTWQLADIASPRGMSKGYPKLLKRISRDLAEQAETLKNIPDKVFALIKDSEGCRLCSLLRDTEAAYIQRLSLFLQNADGFRIYAESPGACLRHLGLLITGISSRDVVRLLLSKAAGYFDQMALDLENYTSKCDSLRRDLITPDEKDASLRAIIHIVGGKNVAPVF